VPNSGEASDEWEKPAKKGKRPLFSGWLGGPGDAAAGTGLTKVVRDNRRTGPETALKTAFRPRFSRLSPTW
jgi:hypothetical protein